MKKRFFKTLFAYLIVTAAITLCIPIQSIMGADTQLIKVDTVVVSIGAGTVSVKISLNGNPGITSMRLHVSYDKDVMTLTSVTDGGILGVSNHPANLALYPYILSWANDTAKSNIEANGTIATLEFELKDGIRVGEYDVSVSYDNDNDDILNYDLDWVEFDIINGKIKVISAHEGDVLQGDIDGDGRVTSKDLLALKKYLQSVLSEDAAFVFGAADVDGDGSVTTKDLLKLKRLLLGVE